MPYLGVLRVGGRDAEGFLQGQLSNDIRRLSDARSITAAYSNPQGRVIACLTLAAQPPDILALLPRELVRPVIDKLQRFVLRAKVDLHDASDELRVVGLRMSDALEGERRRGAIEGAGAAAFAVPHDARRMYVIGARDAWAGAPLHTALADFDVHGALGRDLSRDWRRAHIEAGIPQIFAATSEEFVPQMLNLDALSAISFSKGCYTGQEIIARTQHLGRIKRRMFGLRLPEGEWPPGTPVRLQDRSGRIVDSIGDAHGGVVALAVLPLDADAQRSPSEAPPPVLTDEPVAPDYLRESLGAHVRKQEDVANRS